MQVSQYVDKYNIKKIMKNILKINCNLLSMFSIEESQGKEVSEICRQNDTT